VINLLDFLAELMTWRDIRFTQADRDACEAISLRMAELAYIDVGQGILALMEAVLQESDPFLKNAVWLLGRGLEPEELKKALSYLLLSCNVEGAELLSNFIIAEGILGLQNGLEPRHIHLNLGVLLGKSDEERWRTADKVLSESECFPTLDEFYQSIERPYHEPGELETWILSASVVCLGALFMNVDFNDVIGAVHSLNLNVVKKIMANIPPRIQKNIIVYSQYKSSPKPGKACERILCTLRKLIDAGEVI
jgi:hypothetical protein